MLVLTRKAQERILIGDNIKVTILRVKGNAVRVGIDAPSTVRVVRGELNAKPSPALAAVLAVAPEIAGQTLAIETVAAEVEPAQEEPNEDAPESPVLRRRAPLAGHMLVAAHAV